MTWQAPDLNDEGLRTIQRIQNELGELWKAPKKLTAEEIQNLTPEQAMAVRIHVRRVLVFQLLFQEYHMHEMDDCGDYLSAATDNWYCLFTNLWNNDFQDEVEETKRFLKDLNRYPVGGCDGEARIDLVVNFDGMEDE
jgi:hypothetical protein